MKTNYWIGFFKSTRKEEGSEEGLLKFILQTVFNKLLEKEMTEYLKAEKYEQNEERTGHRNGYQGRNLHTKSSKSLVEISASSGTKIVSKYHP